MKLAYDEVIERINEMRPVDAKDVDGRALKREVLKTPLAGVLNG